MDLSKNRGGFIENIKKFLFPDKATKLYDATVKKDKKFIFLGKEMQKRTAELVVANKELAFQNKEKEKRADELGVANKELAFQNDEKEMRAAELVLANKELAFQNDEKEKRAGELGVANKELAFQNKEKEKRADELSIANEELAFQNDEKEKRAEELRIANEKLAFQNIEKEKRAAELVIANKELAFQNDEKEKRANELDIANKELAFQNKEKEKRAEELRIANAELAFQNSDKEKRAIELAATNLELEAFSYSISHDLRAPLRAINGYSSMLKERLTNQPDVETDRLLNNIIANGKRMRGLIDDLLTFSRLGRKEIVKNLVFMNDMATNISRELKQEGESPHVEFQIKPLISAQADHIAIKQVWVNLISNAIKYSKHKNNARIKISSEIKGDEIIYSIEDNGAGFNMKYSNKLFKVFQRLHSEDEFEGTGVGLAIVERIVTKHGGRVWAHGEENKGATFYFTLKTI